MTSFIARQPIFDTDKKVVAYELLSRSGPENFFQGGDGDRASQQVIDQTLHVFGLDSLSAHKKLFINVTRKILIEDLALILPKEYAVLEVLEDVKPDKEVVQACLRLKKEGYQIALDDYEHKAAMKPLWELADILKIDFMATKKPQRKKLAATFSQQNVDLLAEKVETHEEFQEGIGLGYKLFQGYFFCKPEMVQREDVPGYKINYMRLIAAVNQPSMDFKKLEEIVKQDVSLSVKLLRYINSAAHGVRTRVTSIKHALVLLGEKAVRMWTSVLAYMEMADDKPQELVLTSLIRARFCEKIGVRAGMQEMELDLFLTGLLSTMDALVDRPLDEVLRELPLSNEVMQALLDGGGPLGNLYGVVRAYERGEWEQVSILSQSLGVKEERIPEMYREAVEWSDAIFTV